VDLGEILETAEVPELAAHLDNQVKLDNLAKMA